MAKVISVTVTFCSPAERSQEMKNDFNLCYTPTETVLCVGRSVFDCTVIESEKETGGGGSRWRAEYENKVKTLAT